MALFQRPPWACTSCNSVQQSSSPSHTPFLKTLHNAYKSCLNCHKGVPCTTQPWNCPSLSQDRPSSHWRRFRHGLADVTARVAVLLLRFNRLQSSPSASGTGEAERHVAPPEDTCVGRWRSVRPFLAISVVLDEAVVFSTPDNFFLLALSKQLPGCLEAHNPWAKRNNNTGTNLRYKGELPGSPLLGCVP